MMKLTRLMAAALALLLAAAVPAAALAQGDALPSGMTEADVAAAAEASLGFLWETYGVDAAAVFVQGGEAAVYAYGAEDRAYRWGELSSVLIWVGVVQLAERGMLSLEADVRDYLEEGFLRKLAFDEPITMLHLMNGNAGWEPATRLAAAEAAPSLAQLLRAVEPAQAYAPGTVRTEHAYAALLAAHVIERVSGMEYADYVQANIFAPLGMGSAFLTQAAQLTVPAGVFEGNRAVNSEEPSYSAAYPLDGACGTAQDMAKLLTALLPAGETPLFEESGTAAQLLSNSYCVSEYIPGVSHGIPEVEGSARTLGLDVACVGANGGLRIVPEAGAGVAVLVGNDLAGCTHRSYASWLIGAFAGEPTLPTYEGELPLTAVHAGDYVSADQPQAGYARLAGYVQGLYSASVRPFTNYSRDKIYVSMRMYASQYVGRYTNTVILYNEAVDQVAPNLFTDVSGNLVYFVQEDGETTRMLLGSEEYVPAAADGLAALVDATIYALYALAAYAVCAVGLIAASAVRDKRRGWPSFAATRFHSALCALLLVLSANNIFLLFRSAADVTFAQSRVCLLINIACGIALLLSGIGMGVCWRRGELMRKQKNAYCVTALMAALMLAIILGWQLYC